jgi:hypothetical protein
MRMQVFPLTRLAFDLGVEDVNVLGILSVSFSSNILLLTHCNRS